jgi:hypothetical protein
MSEIPFPVRPDIFVQHGLAAQTADEGTLYLTADHNNVKNVCQLATQDENPPAVDNIIVQPFSEFLRVSAGMAQSDTYIHVPFNMSLAEALEGERHPLHEIRLTAVGPHLTIWSSALGQEKLARGLYTAAIRSTTHNTTAFVGKKERGFGMAIGGGLGLAEGIAQDIITRPDVWSFAENLGVGAAVGMVVGRFAISPLLASLRRSQDMKLIRQRPPIAVTKHRIET